MRIAHIIKHMGRGAGNVCAVVDLACEQAKSGHVVRVYSGGGHFDSVLAACGVEHIIVDHSSYSLAFLNAVRKLHKELRQFRPDIVHAHMMPSAILAACVCSVSGYKLVTTVHNEFQRSAILMGVGQRVIGVSAAVSASMIRRGLSRSRVRTVLNGSVGSPRFPPVVRAPAELQRPAVLTVCGQHPRKGVQDLIAAFSLIMAEFPSSHLYVVGSGPCQQEYEALATSLCPGRFSFMGHQDDPRPFLAAADVFVLASHLEPAGLVLAEAREAGCAIVATNVGGIPEMIDQGAAGIIVPPSEPKSLAAALARLMREPALLAEMRTRARIGVERFTVARVASDTEQVYAELLGAARVPT